MPYKCCFQDAYLDDESFKVCLKKDEKDIKKIFCKICCKFFSIANGGIESLKLHAKGKKHGGRFPVPGRAIGFNKSSEKDNNQEKETVQKQASLTDMISRDQTIKAEII